MRRPKRSILDLDLAGKQLFLRVDFNVPLRDGQVLEDTRIRASLPTLEVALRGGARTVVASHLGRPKGKRVEALSLAPVARHLATLLGREVAFVGDCVGKEVEQQRSALEPGELLLLENLRFHAGERQNDAQFVRQLARGVEEYVNDAFGAAHRAHASTVGVPRLLGRGASGLLMARELEFLGRVLEQPRKPVVAILGGAKISDKIEVIENLLGLADSLLIGGGMAFTFLRALGFNVGNSLVEEEKIEVARSLMSRARSRAVSLELPVDHVVARRCQAGEETRLVSSREIPPGWMGLDIGPATVERFGRQIARARTLIWNGPLGVFEVEPFAAGTLEVARAVAESSALSLVGGGDSVAAVGQAGVASRISHISTGGGASLEFLAGKTLPGVEVLSEKEES